MVYWYMGTCVYGTRMVRVWYSAYVYDTCIRVYGTCMVRVWYVPTQYWNWYMYVRSLWHQLAVWCHIPICANTWIRWHAGTLVHQYANNNCATPTRPRLVHWAPGFAGSAGSTSLACKNPVISPYGATQLILLILPILSYPATGRPGTRGTHVLCHGCARLGTTLVSLV